MRKTIAKYIGLPLFDTIRRTQVQKYLRFYKSTLSWDQKRIKKFQLDKLILLTKYAYENVPFYRKRFEENNLTHNSINSLDDLRYIPPLTRKDIQDNVSELISENINLKKINQGSSSGSTGQPVIYYHDKKGISAGQAANYLGWSLSGWKFGEKGLHIWGNPRIVNNEWKRLSSKIKAVLFNHFKYPAYKLTEIDKFNELISILNKEKFDFLDGYTNALYILANYLKENNIKIDKIKYIFTTGESMHDFQRVLIENFLGKVYDSYGCGEINGIAYQCKFCKQYHSIEPHVILEYDNNLLDHEGNRELIITDLDNFSFPLIRYKNGDMAKPIEEKTIDCKIKFSRIERIAGRVSDIVQLPDGGYLTVPSFFGSMLLKSINGITHYQIEKISKDKLVVNLVVNSQFSRSDEIKINNALFEYLHSKIQWEIKYVDKIKTSNTGKIKLLIDKTETIK